MRPGLDRRRMRAEQTPCDVQPSLPTEVFVVCEEGKPIAAAVTEQGAREAGSGLAKSAIRIHLVPIIEATS